MLQKLTFGYRGPSVQSKNSILTAKLNTPDTGCRTYSPKIRY